MLRRGDSNVVMISGILGQSTGLFDSEPPAKVSSGCLLVSSALMISGV